MTSTDERKIKMELTVSDIRDLLSSGTSAGPDPLDPKPGEKVIIRTVTMMYTGRVVAVSPHWFVLDAAAWIADSGRWANCLAAGAVNEVEPMGDGVRVGRGTIVDCTPWRHELPAKQQ
jgi:hypothetical protein